MPETTSNAETSPSTVGKAFMRHYYQFLAKDPQSLHRFYKDESLWCHGTGSQMQEPISGQRAINDEILRRGYTGVRVDLEHGSIDCQGSLSGGVFVLVTGVMTFAGAASVPKPFVQTFFLAVQPNGFFVLNDCLRFLELPSTSTTVSTTLSAADAAVAPKDVKKSTTQSAIGTPVQSSPAPKGSSKPVTPVAAAKKQDKTPAPPVTKPVEEPVPASPTKTTVKSPVKAVTSPKPVAASPAPSSPVKKTAATPAQDAPKTATAKPSETKTATPASPAPAKPATVAAAAVIATPASPATKAKPVSAPVAAPVQPPAPAKPTTWASLFNPSAASHASASAAVVAPASAFTPKVAAAAPAAVPPSTSPTKASKPAETTATPSTKPKYFTIFVREVPTVTKESELREVFKQFGSIAIVNIISNRGYAFVDFHQEESMRAALAMPSGEFKVHGKTLLVSERKDMSGGGGRGNGGRGPAGGRGYSKNTGGRSFHDNKESRRPVEGSTPSSTNGPRSNVTSGGSARNQNKGGRRVGKDEGASN